VNELEYLLKEYKERIQALSDALAFNHITSYEEYKYTCGQIRGLEAACFIIQDLQRNREHSDNE